MPATNFPIVLQNGLSLLDGYLDTHAVKYGRSGERHRGMRCDRKNHILGVASVMLRGSSLQYDGLICHFSGKWIRPMCVAEIANIAKICRKTVSRCIADMVDLGLIETTQIKRKNPKTGQVEVSIGIRRFTKKFWKALGLWEFFKQGCQWAKKHGRRQLVIPFKSVSLKVKKTFEKAGDLVQSVLSELSEGQIRAVNNCNRIIAMLKGRK